MSNVLIGIIGVILFIGLALAGALFLGPRFQQTTANSKAAAVMSQIKQVSDAMNLEALDNGGLPQTCRNLEYLAPRYLKNIPITPITGKEGDFFYSVQMNTDPFAENSPTMASCVGKPELVIMEIGPEDDQPSKDICQVIADQYSGGVVSTQGSTPKASGCVSYGGYLAAYQKI